MSATLLAGRSRRRLRFASRWLVARPGCVPGLIGVGALDDPDLAGRPFVRGVIALTLIWLYAGLLPAASLVAFRSAAIGPTVIFATVGLATVGLRRVDAIAIPAGIEWWRNLAWLAALAGLIVLLGVVAITFAGQLHPDGALDPGPGRPARAGLLRDLRGLADDPPRRATAAAPDAAPKHRRAGDADRRGPDRLSPLPRHAGDPDGATGDGPAVGARDDQ